MKRKEKHYEKASITKKLQEVGACWAVRDDKYISPNDPGDDWEKKACYHIHPDGEYPHQNNILMFSSLSGIQEWIRIAKKAQAASSDEEAYKIWEEYKLSKM